LVLVAVALFGGPQFPFVADHNLRLWMLLRVTSVKIEFKGARIGFANPRTFFITQTIVTLRSLAIEDRVGEEGGIRNKK